MIKRKWFNVIIVLSQNRCAHATSCVWRTEDGLLELGTSSSRMWAWGSNWTHQACASLEPSHWSQTNFIYRLGKEVKTFSPWIWFNHLNRLICSGLLGGKYNVVKNSLLYQNSWSNQQETEVISTWMRARSSFCLCPLNLILSFYPAPELSHHYSIIESSALH